MSRRAFWLVLVLATYAVTTLALTTGASPATLGRRPVAKAPATTIEELSWALTSPFGG